MGDPTEVLQHEWQETRALHHHIILIGVDRDATWQNERLESEGHEAGKKGYAAIVVLFALGVFLIILGGRDTVILTATGIFFVLLSIIATCGVRQGNNAGQTIDRRTVRAYSYYCYDMRDQSIKCCIINKETNKLMDVPGKSNLGYIEDIEKIEYVKHSHDHFVNVTFHKESGKYPKSNVFIFNLSKEQFVQIMNEKIDQLYEIGLDNIERAYHNIYGTISSDEVAVDEFGDARTEKNARQQHREVSVNRSQRGRTQSDVEGSVSGRSGVSGRGPPGTNRPPQQRQMQPIGPNGQRGPPGPRGPQQGQMRPGPNGPRGPGPNGPNGARRPGPNGRPMNQAQRINQMNQANRMRRMGPNGGQQQGGQPQGQQRRPQGAPAPVNPKNKYVSQYANQYQQQQQRGPGPRPGPRPGPNGPRGPQQGGPRPGPRPGPRQQQQHRPQGSQYGGSQYGGSQYGGGSVVNGHTYQNSQYNGSQYGGSVINHGHAHNASQYNGSQYNGQNEEEYYEEDYGGGYAGSQYAGSQYGY